MMVIVPDSIKRFPTIDASSISISDNVAKDAMAENTVAENLIEEVILHSLHIKLVTK